MTDSALTPSPSDDVHQNSPPPLPSNSELSHSSILPPPPTTEIESNVNHSQSASQLPLSDSSLPTTIAKIPQSSKPSPSPSSASPPSSSSPFPSSTDRFTSLSSDIPSSTSSWFISSLIHLLKYPLPSSSSSSDRLRFPSKSPSSIPAPSAKKSSNTKRKSHSQSEQSRIISSEQLMELPIIGFYCCTPLLSCLASLCPSFGHPSQPSRAYHLISDGGGEVIANTAETESDAESDNDSSSIDHENDLNNSSASSHNRLTLSNDGKFFTPSSKLTDRIPPYKSNNAPIPKLAPPTNDVHYIKPLPSSDNNNHVNDEAIDAELDAEMAELRSADDNLENWFGEDDQNKKGGSRGVGDGEYEDDDNDDDDNNNNVQKSMDPSLSFDVKGNKLEKRSNVLADDDVEKLLDELDEMQ